MAKLDSKAIVAVIGAGAMGAGIAQVAAEAGHQVKLYDNREGAAQRGVENIRAQIEKRVSRGKLNQDTAAALMSRLAPVDQLHELAQSHLIIEAIIENLQAKQQLFAELESICSSETLFASNTSSLSITSIAAALQHPERVAGLHFFNPAPVMQLVEIVSGLATDTKVAETLYATAKAWGKIPVHASSTPGFIVNRVARPFYAESLRLLQEQVAEPGILDALMRQAGGFRMGPFELMDLIGHDVNYAVTHSVFNAYYGDTRFEPSLVQKALVDAGRLGRKSGYGFYDHSTDACPIIPEFAQETNMTLPPLIVEGRVDIFSQLLARAETAGIEVILCPSAAERPHLRFGDLVMTLSDGRCATERAVDENLESLVLFDLCFDYSQTDAIGLTASSATPDNHRNLATAFFQSLGMKVAWLDDTPGLLVLRTVAMLANEAADAVLQGVCTVSDCDRAMQFGVNYPRGPLAWADLVGLEFIHQTLQNIQRSYGEERYRPSFLLRRKALAMENFHG